jgi:hypothetical protein
MSEARVKRLICVMGFGAGDSRGRGGFVWKNGSPRLKNESGWLQRKIESICAHQLMTPRYPK